MKKQHGTAGAKTSHDPPPRLREPMPSLGECLRAIRFKRRLSIADVTVATGISRSTLSRVERDKLSLTYDKLLQLCHGLQVDFSELFSPHTVAGGEQRSLTRRSYTPPDGGRRVAVGSSLYRYLCTDLTAKHMTPMVVDIEVATGTDASVLRRHAGEEFTVVLEGTVELRTEFYEPMVLERGGSIYFDSTMAHTYVAKGGMPARILCVCSAGETALNPPEQPGAAVTQVAPSPRQRGDENKLKPLRTRRR